MLDKLGLDIINIIIQMLTYDDIKQLFISCKTIYNMRHELLYYSMIDVEKVLHLSYFNQFRRLHYDCRDGLYPYFGSQVCSLFWNNNVSLTKLYHFVNLTHLDVHINSDNKLFTESGQHVIPPVNYLRVSCTDIMEVSLTYQRGDGVISFIPPGVEIVVLDFNESVSIKDLIPYGVISLTFRRFWHDISDLISIKYIPDSVLYLNLSGYFNQPIITTTKISALPSKLIELNLGNSYKHSLINLPATLQELYLGELYAKKIPVMPSGLKKIVFGDNFNHLLKDKLPDGLTHLTLGFFFKQPLIGLPSTLIYLELNGQYNQELPVMPATLRYLRLGFNFNQSIDNSLNDNLHTLILGSGFKVMVTKLPPKLKKLEIYHSVHPSIMKVLPNELEQIIIRRSLNETNITMDMTLKKLSPRWPTNLKTLKIYGDTITDFNK